MDNIVSIRPLNNKRLTITLQLTTACTYSCRYCPDTLNKGSNGQFNLDELDQLFAKFSNREIILTITGGECTTHPDFLHVLESARQAGVYTQIDTNSVRSVRFYQEAAALADVWNITLHPSQHQLDLEKITVLAMSSFVVVYVMMDPDYWDTAVNWWNQVCRIDNIKVIPLKVINNWSGAQFETTYTKEQNNWLLDTKSILNLTDQRKAELIKTHTWLMDADSMYTLDTGYQGNLNGYTLVKQGLNKFYGWSCSAGNENIVIHSTGGASWASCGIKQYKHFLDIEPAELAHPITCNRLECNCITDIRATKHA